MIPTPTPEQAVHILYILGQWTKRGWRHSAFQRSLTLAQVDYTDPEHPDQGLAFSATGVGLFDALCQATTVMQVLLDEHPEKP